MTNSDIENEIQIFEYLTIARKAVAHAMKLPTKAERQTDTVRRHAVHSAVLYLADALHFMGTAPKDLESLRVGRKVMLELLKLGNESAAGRSRKTA